MEHTNETGVMPAGEEALQVRPIEVITSEIQLFKQQAGAAILEIGRRLIEAKAQLDHGAWREWLEREVDFSERSAQNFMRLAREWKNPQTFADLGTSKALELLALPESERDQFMEEKHPVNGEEKTVAEMSARELKKAIAERDEARKAADKAGEAWLEMERRAKKAEQAADEAAREAERAEQESRRLRVELEELKNKPAEVATVTVRDEEAIREARDVARREAITSMEVRVKKAEDAKKRAEDAKAKAEEEAARIRAEQESAAATARRENQQLVGELNDMRKRVAMASSGDAVLFKEYFEQLQGVANKALAAIDRIEEAGDADTAARLKNALRQLASAISARAE